MNGLNDTHGRSTGKKRSNNTNYRSNECDRVDALLNGIAIFPSTQNNDISSLSIYSSNYEAGAFADRSESKRQKTAYEGPMLSQESSFASFSDNVQRNSSSCFSKNDFRGQENSHLGGRGKSYNTDIVDTTIFADVTNVETDK